MIVSALDAYNYAYDHFPTFPPSWKISDNFTWNEVFTNECISDGMPMLEVYENAVQLAKQLQIVRTKIGKPIIPHCWVRQIKHNKRAGSIAKRSPHINGRAIDFHINGMAESDIRKKILEMKLPLRIEADTKGWVHIDIGNSYTNNYNWGVFKA